MPVVTEPETLGALDSLATDAVAEYKQLAIDYAQGREPSLKKIRDCLAMTGKSIDEFKRQTELLQKRLAAAAVLAEFSEKQSQLAKLGDQAAAVNQELDNMEVAYRNARQPVHTRYNELMHEFTSQADAVRVARSNALIALEQSASPAIAARRRTIQQRQKKFVGMSRQVYDGPTALRERGTIAAELLELERRQNDPIDGLDWA